MYLYNVSIIIEESAHKDALKWIKQHYLPSLEKKVHFLSMIDSPHEGATYCLQFQASSDEELAQFKETHVATLQAYLGLQHPEKAFIFDSTMKYLESN